MKKIVDLFPVFLFSVLSLWIMFKVYSDIISTVRKEKKPFRITLVQDNSIDVISVDSFKIYNNNLIYIYYNGEEITLVNRRGIYIESNGLRV